MREIIIKTLKGRKVSDTIRRRNELYEKYETRESIAQYQTDRFNAMWPIALDSSPFYRKWAERYSLPRQIGHIKELSDFPVLRKQDLADHHDDLLDFKPSSFYVSGGSTGEPTKFPRHKQENTFRYADNVVTHSWLGLRQGDPYVHLWGHAHLFGQGSKAIVRKQVRKAKDWLVGGYRLNAYNQSRSDIQQWIRAIRTIGPKYIVGYASALVSLAIEIENTSGELNLGRLEWIICTAETVTQVDVDRLQRVFKVPVAIEYGANETGVIAHSRPLRGKRLQFLWGNLAGNCDREGSLKLSTLDPRVFPLVNYEIGDLIEEPDDAKHVLSFRAVAGRLREQISLLMRDGSIGTISMVGVVGAIKNLNGVRTVQASQIEPGIAEIYLTGTYKHDDKWMRDYFLEELGKVGVRVAPNSLYFRHLQEPIKSVAGKTNLLVPKVNN